jgi:hypothetical protein
MPLAVRVYPLIRPIAELQEFLQELLGPRRHETDRFYRQYGVSHESAYLQWIDNKYWLVVVTELEDPVDASKRYGEASQEFHAWFKSRVLYFSGVDPNVTPLGPPTTEVFCWEASAPAADQPVA